MAERTPTGMAIASHTITPPITSEAVAGAARQITSTTGSCVRAWPRSPRARLPRNPTYPPTSEPSRSKRFTPESSLPEGAANDASIDVSRSGTT